MTKTFWTQHAGIALPTGGHDLAKLFAAGFVDGADEAIICASPDGLVRDWNPAAELIFGYTAAEVLGTAIDRLYPAHLKSQEEERLKRLNAGEKILPYES